MATELPMIAPVCGAKMENENPVAIILGNPTVVTEIPYDEQTIGIRQFEGIPEYYCALKAKSIMLLSQHEVILLRNDLEGILSRATGKEMELGFAEFAENASGKLVVMCYFKERGVPQCQKSKSSISGKMEL